MTRKEIPVDPLDASAALSDIQGKMRQMEMSVYDLALELGWEKNKVEEFLYGTDIPKRSTFEEVASVLDYELDFEE